ncbi:protein of unknown function [Paraburkholderia kururiensis]
MTVTAARTTACDAMSPRAALECHLMRPYWAAVAPGAIAAIGKLHEAAPGPHLYNRGLIPN